MGLAKVTDGVAKLDAMLGSLSAPSSLCDSLF